jgi:hypothetical protein
MYTTREENKINKNPTATRGKWIQTFDEAKNQIMNLPDWAQGILIEDITTALQNRIIIMNNANKNIQEMQYR